MHGQCLERAILRRERSLVSLSLLDDSPLKGSCALGTRFDMPVEIALGRNMSEAACRLCLLHLCMVIIGTWTWQFSMPQVSLWPWTRATSDYGSRFFQKLAKTCLPLKMAWIGPHGNMVTVVSLPPPFILIVILLSLPWPFGIHSCLPHSQPNIIIV